MKTKKCKCENISIYDGKHHCKICYKEFTEITANNVPYVEIIQKLESKIDNLRIRVKAYESLLKAQRNQIDPVVLPEPQKPAYGSLRRSKYSELLKDSETGDVSYPTTENKSDIPPDLKKGNW